MGDDSIESVALEVSVKNWELNYSGRTVDFTLDDKLETVLPVALAGDDFYLFGNAFAGPVVAEDTNQFEPDSSPDSEESFELHFVKTLVNGVVELVKEVVSLVSDRKSVV